MVIIPTEKRFDWQRPPFVLFLLVLSNVLIFFFLQDEDQEKFYQAMSRYEQLEYFETEWPLYLQYLKETKVSDRTVLRNEKLYDLGEHGLLAQQLVTDKPFYDYLRYNQVRFQEPEKGDYWKDREAIVSLINETSIYGYGLKPKELNPISLLTHQFLHGDLLHLMGNMFFLIVFGFAVEAAIGQIRFLIFYLLSGLAGGILFMTVNADSPSALVGASGAISGVMAMYLGVFRLRKIEFFYWLFIFVGFIRAPALWVLALYIANELFNFMTQTDSNVAFMAHIGGFIAGAILVLTTYLVNPKAFDEEYMEADEQHSPEQQARTKIYQLMSNFAFDSAVKQIDTYQAQYEFSFELALLRYRILKTWNDDQLLDCAVELMKKEKLDPEQMLQIEKIWRSTECAESQFNNQELLALGWRTCAIDNLKLAEDLFVMLYSRGVKTEELSHFARKLSVCFGQKEHDAKCKKYAKAADEIYDRSRGFSSF